MFKSFWRFIKKFYIHLFFLQKKQFLYTLKILLSERYQSTNNTPIEGGLMINNCLLIVKTDPLNIMSCDEYFIGTRYTARKSK